MSKILLFLLILIPFSTNAAESNNIETISETSTDINSDKSKIYISDDLTIESGFGNNSSDASDLSKYMLSGLKVISIFISSVALIALSFLVGKMIFITDPNEKGKTKKLIIYTAGGFIFYGFLAGSVYVWIIEQGKKSSSPYYNEVIENTLNDSSANELKPKLLRPE